MEEYNSILKYRYENKQNFMFEQDNKTIIENLTVLIDRDTGIPVGASWLSTFPETGVETQHYLTIENTNMHDVKDGIEEYERSYISFHLY